jgi:beta-phosphoglucomutase-like phosphatase (HAD superfamily)
MTTAGIRAVVFDMDGLMLDTEPIYKVAWQAASAELGYDLDDAFYAGFVGRPNGDCERLLLERFGAAFPLARFRARWPRRWSAEVDTRGIRQKDGLLDLLTLLDNGRVPFAIATSSGSEEATFCLRAAGLDGRFSVIVTSDQVANGKPAPAGILAASRAGLVPVLIPDMAPPSDVAVRAAFRVVASLTEAQPVIRDLIDGAW